MESGQSMFLHFSQWYVLKGMAASPFMRSGENTDNSRTLCTKM